MKLSEYMRVYLARNGDCEVEGIVLIRLLRLGDDYVVPALHATFDLEDVHDLMESMVEQHREGLTSETPLHTEEGAKH